MAHTYSYELQSVFSEAEKIPALIEELDGQLSMKSEMKDRLTLALSEAVTNAIVHGNREDLSKRVYVAIEITDTKITASVLDEGDGFQANDVPDPLTDENILKTGGRGLLFMEEFADNVHYGQDGRQVILEFNR